MHSIFPYGIPDFSHLQRHAWQRVDSPRRLACYDNRVAAGRRLFPLALQCSATFYLYYICNISTLYLMIFQKRTAAARARPTTKRTLYVCLETDPLVFVLADKQTDRQQTEHEDKRSVSLSATRRLSRRAQI